MSWEGPTRSGNTLEEVGDKRVKKTRQEGVGGGGRMLDKIQTQRT